MSSRKLSLPFALFLLIALLTACGAAKTTPTASPSLTAASAPTRALIGTPVHVGATPTAVPSPAKPKLTRIRLPMGYIPNIQYAPFYVAKDKGFYAEAGFDVDFDYSFETDGVALVGAGKLPFAIVSGEQVLMARDKGLPVVYVMTWWQKYPVVVVADAALGLKTPADLKGQRIGLPGLFGANYIGLVALLHSVGLTEQDVTLDSIGFNQVEAFTSGKERIVVGYVTNEPIQLRAKGYKITTLPVADYVDLASNGIITNEKTIKDNPEMVHRFVRATLRGINYTIHYPDDAYNVSLKYVEGLSSADRDVQMQILHKAIEYWRADKLGYANPQAWENMKKVLRSMGLVTHDLDVSKAYTNQFIRP